jgi:hypothetical protein
MATYRFHIQVIRKKHPFSPFLLHFPTLLYYLSCFLLQFLVHLFSLFSSFSFCSYSFFSPHAIFSTASLLLPTLLLPFSSSHCSILSQSKNCGAKKKVIARKQLCKRATIPEPSLKNVRTQQWRHCLKRCFLCGPRRVYLRTLTWCVEAGSNTSTVTLRVVGRRKGKSQI